MSDHVEIVKWYTRARRFPRLVGRTHTGGKIWGGPYTITQVIGAVIIVVTLLNTTALWARGSLFTNVFILIAVSYTAVLALGKIPPDARNPLSVATGALLALSSPRGGRRRGTPLRPARTHRVRARITFDAPTAALETTSAPTQAPRSPAPTSTTAPAGARTLSPTGERRAATTSTSVEPAVGASRPAPTGLERALARSSAGRPR